MASSYYGQRFRSNKIHSIMNVRVKVVTIFLSLLVVCSEPCFSQGKIDKSKGDLKRGSTRERTRTRGSSFSNNDFDNPLLEFAARAFLYVSYYSFFGNYAGEDHLHSDLTPYPYFNQWSGNYGNPDSLSDDCKYFRLDIENQLLYDLADLGGNHLKVKIRPFQYFYFQADYFQLLEIVRPRESVSNLALFNFTLCYDRIRFEKFNLGWSLGLNYVASDVQKTGISVGLNADIFLFKNFSLYSSAKWGNVNSNPVNEFEIKCKFHKKKYFYSMGYEHLRIGSPNYNFLAAGAGIYL
jgi:hypothetical protein